MAHMVHLWSPVIHLHIFERMYTSRGYLWQIPISRTEMFAYVPVVTVGISVILDVMDAA